MALLNFTFHIDRLIDIIFFCLKITFFASNMNNEKGNSFFFDEHRKMRAKTENSKKYIRGLLRKKLTRRLEVYPQADYDVKINIEMKGVHLTADDWLYVLSLTDTAVHVPSDDLLKIIAGYVSSPEDIIYPISTPQERYQKHTSIGEAICTTTCVSCFLTTYMCKLVVFFF